MPLSSTTVTMMQHDNVHNCSILNFSNSDDCLDADRIHIVTTEDRQRVSTESHDWIKLCTRQSGTPPPISQIALRLHSPHCNLPDAFPLHRHGAHLAARHMSPQDANHLVPHFHFHDVQLPYQHLYHLHHHRHHHLYGKADEEDSQVLRPGGSAAPTKPQPPPFTAYSKPFKILEKCPKESKQKEIFALSFSPFVFSLTLPANAPLTAMQLEDKPYSQQSRMIYRSQVLVFHRITPHSSFIPRTFRDPSLQSFAIKCHNLRWNNTDRTTHVLCDIGLDVDHTYLSFQHSCCKLSNITGVPCSCWLKAFHTFQFQCWLNAFRMLVVGDPHKSIFEVLSF